MGESGALYLSDASGECPAEDEQQEIAMKLLEALFREPWRAYQVPDDCDWDNFEEWNLQPLSGATLAAEDVEDLFQGYFIIAAHLVSSEGVSQPCYLDLTLPERIVEHRFIKIGDRIERRRGRCAENGTVIPAIGIEKFGDYTLFFAKENPSAGINVLQSGMPNARHRDYLAYDLAFLLRDQKRYEEAIDAFSIVLEEGHAAEIAPVLHMLYRERAQLYAAVGQPEKAEADRHRYTMAFQKNYGHTPGPHEM